jgi:hypothetical protein
MAWLSTRGHVVFDFVILRFRQHVPRDELICTVIGPGSDDSVGAVAVDPRQLQQIGFARFVNVHRIATQALLHAFGEGPGIVLQFSSGFCSFLADLVRGRLLLSASGEECSQDHERGDEARNLHMLWMRTS